MSAEPSLKSPEEFLKSTSALLSGRFGGKAIDPVGAPEKIQIEGRDFWKLNLNLKSVNGIVSEAEIVTFEKNYLLLFVVSGPDNASRDALVQRLQYLQFVEKP